MPSVYSISPDHGDTGSTISVTLSGEDFASGATAGIDNGIASIDLISVTVVSTREIIGTLDLSIAAGGPYDVQVTNPGPDQQSGMAANAFTVTIPITYSYLITATGTYSTYHDVHAIGAPDTTAADIASGGVIMGDFGPGNGIMDGRGHDFVFYEECELTSYIWLDSIVIELPPDQQTWYEVFHWGDNITDTNTNVASYNYNGDGGEQDGEEIEVSDLYDCSGILIDISFLSGPPDARYRYVRLSCPVGHDCHYTEVDAIERLPSAPS